MHTTILLRTLFVTALLALGLAAAQPVAERSLFLGTVGDLAVRMELTFDEHDDTVRGWYDYDHVGVPIELEGGHDGAGKLWLRERSEGVKTGSFRGELHSEPRLLDIVIDGTWSAPDGRTLPFRLERVADYAVLELRQGRIEARRSLPFFVAEPYVAFNRALHDGALAELSEFFEEGRMYLLQGEMWFGWTLDEASEVHYLAPGLLSARSSIYSYTGGAHGNLYFRVVNLELVGGKSRPLGLADLFAPGADWPVRLSELVLADLRAQGAFDAVEGTITTLDADDLATFVFSPTGIEFAFAPYQVGPYAQGSFFVQVPLARVADLLDPQGPLGRFALPR